MGKYEDYVDWAAKKYAKVLEPVYKKAYESDGVRRFAKKMVDANASVYQKIGIDALGLREPDYDNYDTNYEKKQALKRIGKGVLAKVIFRTAGDII